MARLSFDILAIIRDFMTNRSAEDSKNFRRASRMFADVFGRDIFHMSVVNMIYDDSYIDALEALSRAHPGRLGGHQIHLPFFRADPASAEMEIACAQLARVLAILEPHFKGGLPQLDGYFPPEIVRALRDALSIDGQVPLYLWASEGLEEDAEMDGLQLRMSSRALGCVAGFNLTKLALTVPTVLEYTAAFDSLDLSNLTILKAYVDIVMVDSFLHTLRAPRLVELVLGLSVCSFEDDLYTASQAMSAAPQYLLDRWRRRVIPYVKWYYVGHRIKTGQDIRIGFRGIPTVGPSPPSARRSQLSRISDQCVAHIEEVYLDWSRGGWDSMVEERSAFLRASDLA